MRKPARVRVVEGEHTGDWSYYKGAFNEGRRSGGEYYFPKRWPMKERGMPVDGKMWGKSNPKKRVPRYQDYHDIFGRKDACEEAKRKVRGKGGYPYEFCFCVEGSQRMFGFGGMFNRDIWECSVEYTVLPR